VTKSWTLRRDDLMTREELLTLLRHLRERAELAERRRTKTAIRNEAIVMTAVATGLRRSEIAALDIGDLRLHNENPYLVVRHGKGDKYREVPLSSRFRAFLKRYLRIKEQWGEPLAADAVVFLGERGRYSGGGVARVFKKSCVDAGLRPSLHVHAARHFLGAQLYSLTKDLMLVKKILGHSRSATTDVYVQLEDANVRDGLTRYDALLSGAQRRAGSSSKPTRNQANRRFFDAPPMSLVSGGDA